RSTQRRRVPIDRQGDREGWQTDDKIAAIPGGGMTPRLGLLGCLVLAPLALPGQDAGVRRELTAWRDSLDRISDVELLSELHHRVLGRADSLRGEPIAELRLGIAAL